MLYKLYAFAKTPFTPQKAGLRCIPTQILPPSRRRDLREEGGQGVGVRNDYGKESVLRYFEQSVSCWKQGFEGDYPRMLSMP